MQLGLVIHNSQLRRRILPGFYQHRNRPEDSCLQQQVARVRNAITQHVRAADIIRRGRIGRRVTRTEPERSAGRQDSTAAAGEHQIRLDTNLPGETNRTTSAKLLCCCLCCLFVFASPPPHLNAVVGATTTSPSTPPNARTLHIAIKTNKLHSTQCNSLH